MIQHGQSKPLTGQELYGRGLGPPARPVFQVLKSFTCLVIMSLLLGCSNLSSEGQVLAEKGNATAESAVAYYEKLEYYSRATIAIEVFRNEMTEAPAVLLLRQLEADVSKPETSTPAKIAALESETKALAERRTIIAESLAISRRRLKAIQARKALAETLRDTYGSLKTLSEFDARGTVAGSAAKLDTAMKGVINSQFPNVDTTGIFAKAIDLLITIDKNSDIKKGAKALEESLVGIQGLLQKEMTQTYPTLSLSDPVVEHAFPGRTALSPYTHVVAEWLLKSSALTSDLASYGALDNTERLTEFVKPLTVKLRTADVPKEKKPLLEASTEALAIHQLVDDAIAAEEAGGRLKSSVDELLLLHRDLIK